MSVTNVSYTRWTFPFCYVIFQMILVGPAWVESSDIHAVEEPGTVLACKTLLRVLPWSELLSKSLGLSYTV